MLPIKPSNKIAPLDAKTKRLLLLSGGATASSLAIASPSHAQSTTIDPSTVGTQLTAVQTGILAVGGTLLAMAMGILLFQIGSGVIKRVTKR